MSYRYGDEDYRGGNRWDRDRFERVRAKSRPRERESFGFSEHDRYGPRGTTRDFHFDDRFDRRGSRGGWEERDRFVEDERFTSPRRSKFEFKDDERYRSGKEVAPFMDRFDRGPARPGVIRRQSSWDGFDRRPHREAPYYDYNERGGEHQNNDVKLNIRMGSPDHHDHHDARSRSARPDHDDRWHDRFDERIDIRERDRHDGRSERFDERIDIRERDGRDDRRLKKYDSRTDVDDHDRRNNISININEGHREEPNYYDRGPDPRHYRDYPQPEWREYRDNRDYEDYNGARIVLERERTIDRRARSPSRERARSLSHEREHSRIEPRISDRGHEERETYEYKEEIKEERPLGTKKGKTRMPKRLVHRRALLDLDYPFDEEVRNLRCCTCMRLLIRA